MFIPWSIYFNELPHFDSLNIRNNNTIYNSYTAYGNSEISWSYDQTSSEMGSTYLSNNENSMDHALETQISSWTLRIRIFKFLPHAGLGKHNSPEILQIETQKNSSFSLRDPKL